MNLVLGDLSRTLNPQQLTAVKCLEGPLLVFAGAGTGKTRVITYRIAHLLEKDVPPENILAVTFTNKAAEEMRSRVEKLVPGKGKRVWISTFHSFGAKVLRMEAKVRKTEYGKRITAPGINPNFVIYDEVDQKDLLKECIRELGLEEKKYRPGLFRDLINRAKDDLIDAESYGILALANADQFRQIVALVYQRYEKKLLLAGALDFGDLIMKTVFLLRDNLWIREKYQRQFRYLLIDEYQDTNRAQYLLTKYLAEKHKNICVVGDDDQAIYSWRGANVENLFQFEIDYPQAKVVKLERNYRSTPEILDSAWQVIKNNQYRKEKRLWTRRVSGSPVSYDELGDEIEEAKYVINQVKALSANCKLSEIAIFYRINAQSRVFEDRLRKEKIPYKVVGTLRFYERAEIKDIFAYLRLIYNPQDNLSLKRIINRPGRGVGKTTIAKIEKYAQDEKISLFQALGKVKEIGNLPLRTCNAIGEFMDLINALIAQKDKVTVGQLTRRLLERSRYIEELELEDTVEAHIRIENLEELVSAIAEFEERSPDKSLATYLEEVSLISSAETSGLPEEKKEMVTLMTFHLAKGLEFPVVFVTGLEEGLFPLGDAIFSQEELEEERRLCYVGMTRAKDLLYLTSAQMRKVYGYPRENVPSRFIDEAFLLKPRAKSQELRTSSLFAQDSMLKATWRVGQRVKHEEFGDGRIVGREGSGENLKITVRFDTAGTKKLLVKYANLQKL